MLGVLDIEEMLPESDLVAVRGTVVPFEVVLGPEHPVAETEFEWLLDGATQESLEASCRVATEGLSIGTHAVELRIRDENYTRSLGWELQVVEEEPANRPPTILQAIPPGGRALAQGSEAHFAIVATDVDAADPLSYAWYLDGKKLSGKSREIDIATQKLALGSHVVSVVVSDQVARSSEDETVYTWVLAVEDADSHEGPWIRAAWPIGSPRFGLDETLRFEVEADLSTSEDEVAFRWEVDGVLQRETGPVFHFQPGGDEDRDRGAVHRVTASLLGGTEENLEVNLPVGWTVQVGRPQVHGGPDSTSGDSNQAPVVLRGSSSATAQLAAGDSGVFRVAALDSDGDILTHQWFIDGDPLVAAGPVLTYIPEATVPGGTSAGAAAGGSSRIEVLVSDGYSAGAEPVKMAWDLLVTSPGYRALTPAQGSVILDNGDAGTSATGDWKVSTSGGSYGSDSIYSKSAGDTYVYTVPLSAPGKYDVLLWWTDWTSRSTAVPVTIRHSTASATVKINQSISGGKWNLLGTYDFSTSAKITILSEGYGYSTCADAVCLSPAASAPADGGGTTPAPTGSEFVIDDGAAGTSSVGVWSSSSAPNPYGGRSLYAKGSGSYVFQRSLAASGSYDVYAWWTQWSSRDAAVPYDVTHSKGTTTVTKDQRTAGGRWNLLGRWTFGTVAKVTVRVPGATTACADAIRFVPAGGATEPDGTGVDPGDIVRDNGDSGTSADGSWVASGAPDPWDGGSLYAKSRGSYVYDVTLPSAGTYGVLAWWTAWPSRGTAVPYEVRHASGTAVSYVNQQGSGGRWNFLGNYTFGTSGRVTIRVVDESTVCADAVRFVPGGWDGSTDDSTVPPTPPPVSGSPTITELAAFPLTPTLARVSWKTNFLGDSTVYLGTTSAVSDRTRNIAGQRWEHSVVLESMVAGQTYYAKVKSANSTASQTSSVVSFRMPQSIPSYTVSASHPRVYFNSADVDRVRSRLSTSPYSEWWTSVNAFANQQIKKPVSTLITEYPTYNAAVAFAGLVGQNSAFRDNAIAVALKVATLADTDDNKVWREHVDYIIPAYDWLHAYLTASAKATLSAKLASLATLLESKIRSDEYADGHSNGNQNGAFLAALAVHGEVSSAAGVVSRGLKRYNEGFWPFWREHGSENGGSFKSGWYTTVATEFNNEVFLAWKSATGQSLYSVERTWFEGLSDWYLYSLRGDMSWVRHGDVVYQQGVDEVERYLLLQIANQYGNGEAQWLASKVRDYLGVWGPEMVQDLLWYNPSVSAKAPTKALSRHFKGSGMVFMLESWKDDSVRANFRAVPYYMGGHGHLDQCSFSIFYRKGLALDSGIYDSYASTHWLNYYSRTVAHNSILVMDPKEQFLQYGNLYTSDGGQNWLQPSRVPYPFPQTITDLTSDDSFDLIGIEAYEDNDTYTYSMANGALAYSASKLSAFHRHFLWLKALPGWRHPVVVVFDEVESTSSAYKKSYLLHTAEKPAVSGSLVTMTNGAGMLYQRTVFPQSFALATVGGAGQESWVNGRNWPASRAPKAGEEPGAWRVEVSPATARLHDEFLHLLYPTEAGTAAPPSVRAIDAGSMKGVEMQDLVLLFANKLKNVTTASYTIGGQRRNLLFGLSPGKSYDVVINGSKQATMQATVSGTLSFVVSAYAKVDLIAK